MKKQTPKPTETRIPKPNEIPIGTTVYIGMHKIRGTRKPVESESAENDHTNDEEKTRRKNRKKNSEE